MFRAAFELGAPVIVDGQVLRVKVSAHRAVKDDDAIVQCVEKTFHRSIFDLRLLLNENRLEAGYCPPLPCCPGHVPHKSAGGSPPLNGLFKLSQINNRKSAITKPRAANNAGPCFKPFSKQRLKGLAELFSGLFYVAASRF